MAPPTLNLSEAPMHLHLLKHHPDLGPARIGDWLASMGHSFTVFHLYDGELVPRPGDCDALIILDDLEDRDQAPWLKAERKLIDQMLDGHKPLLGDRPVVPRVNTDTSIKETVFYRDHC